MRRIVSSNWYVPAVFACWVFGPELRRFIDWQSSFHALSIISIVPMLSLLPGVLVFGAQWAPLGPAYRNVVRLWAIAFGYAFLVSFLSGELFPGLYDIALFGVPVLLGVLMVARPSGGIEIDYEKTAHAILILAALTSLYGIVQYIAPPAWDVYWARNANIASQGDTVAFSFRIFGTLNSAGIYADYLAFALLINLPRLKLSRWPVALLATPCIIALILTSVRALWLTLLAGVVLYAILSPRRRDLMLSIGTLVAVVCVIGATLVFTVGGATQSLNTFTTRLQTFSSLNSDSSAVARGSETTIALREGFEEPLGQGLGILGQATKLSDSGGGGSNGLDSGYFARFIEMGIVGFAVYVIAVGVAGFTAFSTYRRYASAGNTFGASVAAMCLAVQFGLLVAEIFNDHHEGLTALFFWYSVYFASAYIAPAGVRQVVRTATEPVLPQRLGWTA